jgi:hypothetical protein
LEPFSVTACYRVNGNSLILSNGKCCQISHNVLNFQRYNAITNRLLYQLSYVGLALILMCVREGVKEPGSINWFYRRQPLAVIDTGRISNRADAYQLLEL